jgi:hypothetical protein
MSVELMSGCCRYTPVDYRGEPSYFVNLDAAPPTTRSPVGRDSDWNELGGRPVPPPTLRRRRRGITIRPVGVLVLAVLAWVGWAYTTPGGPSARINDWIDNTRNDVAAAGVSPGLRHTTTYFNGLYASQGSYPNMTDTAMQEDPKAGFGLGMKFIWCSPQAVVLQSPSAGGSVSRLLVAGRDLGEVGGAQGCPVTLAKPSPWKLKGK